MHALLIGSWKGTFTAPEGMVRALDLSVAHDSLHNLTLTMRAAGPLHAGAASNIQMTAGELRWTQDLSGISCKASAALNAGTGQVLDVMNGRMVCPNREIGFTLQKRAG